MQLAYLLNKTESSIWNLNPAYTRHRPSILLPPCFSRSVGRILAAPIIIDCLRMTPKYQLWLHVVVRGEFADLGTPFWSAVLTNYFPVVFSVLLKSSCLKVSLISFRVRECYILLLSATIWTTIECNNMENGFALLSTPSKSECITHLVQVIISDSMILWSVVR